MRRGAEIMPKMAAAFPNRRKPAFFPVCKEVIRPVPIHHCKEKPCNRQRFFIFPTFSPKRLDNPIRKRQRSKAERMVLSALLQLALSAFIDRKEKQFDR